MPNFHYFFLFQKIIKRVHGLLGFLYIVSWALATFLFNRLPYEPAQSPTRLLSHLSVKKRNEYLISSLVRRIEYSNDDTPASPAAHTTAITVTLAASPPHIRRNHHNYSAADRVGPATVTVRQGGYWFDKEEHKVHGESEESENGGEANTEGAF